MKFSFVSKSNHGAAVTARHAHFNHFSIYSPPIGAILPINSAGLSTINSCALFIIFLVPSSLAKDESVGLDSIYLFADSSHSRAISPRVFTFSHGCASNKETPLPPISEEVGVSLAKIDGVAGVTASAIDAQTHLSLFFAFVRRSDILAIIMIC